MPEVIKLSQRDCRRALKLEVVGAGEKDTLIYK
ncbi:hypothetical protein AAKU64_003402 [Undibacterium sp. GrIS 1.8]